MVGQELTSSMIGQNPLWLPSDWLINFASGQLLSLVINSSKSSSSSQCFAAIAEILYGEDCFAFLNERSHINFPDKNWDEAKKCAKIFQTQSWIQVICCLWLATKSFIRKHYIKYYCFFSGDSESRVTNAKVRSIRIWFPNYRESCFFCLHKLI